MLQNLEFVVLKSNGIFKGEYFGRDFASVAYYYFLKLKRRKINFCSYIKIWVTNNQENQTFSYHLADKILFISFSYDFTHYLQLSKAERLKFQYKMMDHILNEAFIMYELETVILDNIKQELATNNWQMQIQWIKKKVQKKYLFRLLLNMDIDAFTFIGEITNGNKKDEVFIFKSIPDYFVIFYLFTVFKIIDDKLRLGNKERAVFEIDADKKNVQILVSENDNIIKMYKFKENQS